MDRLMYISVIMVFVAVVTTQSDKVKTGKSEIIIGKAAQCVLDTLPLDILEGENLLLKQFIVNISSQWDPLNPHDYLEWHVYDGPEAWAANCHFSSAIKQCLEPFIVYDIKLHRLPEICKKTLDSIIVPALYFMTLCEHQSTLTDPRTNNAKCVHQRMLSDDVLRCLGLQSWWRGNSLLIVNMDYPQQYDKWISDKASSVYECIYNRGNWRHSCGSDVEAMVWNLTKSFSSLAKSTLRGFYLTTFDYTLCDICKAGSDLTIYDRLSQLKFELVFLLMVKNQSPYYFKTCKMVNYPLNQCHLRLMWRRDVYALFCHQVKTAIIPEFTPYLPLCDLDEYIRSASRICKMGYDMFMDTASHIARCTKDQDELFPCYKGVYMDGLSWGLVSAGRVWDYHSLIDGSHLRTVYKRIKRCIPLLYDHLRRTCKHGNSVVQLIQDLRIVLMMNAPAMYSTGSIWHQVHLKYERVGILVDHC